MKKVWTMLAFCAAAVSAHAQAQVIYSNQPQPNYAPAPAVAPYAQPEVGQGYFTPFTLAFWYPVQLPPGVISVNGIRLNLLYSEVSDMNGIDIGALFSVVNGNTHSLQIAPIIWDKCDAFSLQIGAVEVVGNYCRGAQIGVIESARAMDGLQIGVFNQCDDFHGLQIGVVNTTRNCNGVQIGLVNVIENSELPFFPILNCRF